jgi:DNA-binding MarR family transcriptional regulator
VRGAVDKVVRGGWAAVEPHPQRKSVRIVRLTPEGQRMREAGRTHVHSVEARWRQHLGTETMSRLRDALQSLVQQLPLELSHHPTGYGPGDPRPTGGQSVAVQPGPPRIPAHGQEWPVVLRGRGDTVSALSLPALLSQALTALVIDYEEADAGWFVPAANVLRLFEGDEATPFSDVPADDQVTGSGRSTLERHQIVRVERDPANPRRKRVTLTSRGRAMRDAYLPLTAEIERRWREQYGSTLLDALRASLEALTMQIGADDLPHHPPVLLWLARNVTMEECP